MFAYHIQMAGKETILAQLSVWRQNFKVNNISLIKELSASDVFAASVVQITPEEPQQTRCVSALLNLTHISHLWWHDADYVDLCQTCKMQSQEKKNNKKTKH